MKRLILASLAVAAMLASCEKTSEVDPTITLAGQKISYSAYAGASTTKGTAINSNTDFQGSEGSYNAFMVSAHTGDSTDGAYFGFDKVTYGTSGWTGTSYYWPTSYTKLYFGAYYPSDAAFTATTTNTTTTATYSYASEAHSLAFGYTVGATVADQKDIMYAISECTPDADDTSSVEVDLHFKHALTQVAFTATKESSLTVTVNSLKICNVVNNGDFKATTNTNGDGTITTDQDEDNATSAGDIWTPASASTATNLTNYVATMVDNESGISVTAATDETAIALTSATDVLMLLPQGLTAWDPAGTGSDDSALFVSGTGSYLAIDCKIESGGLTIADGLIYVPFSTEDIDYDGDTDGQWNPGYKITYNLDFGGGYSILGDDDENAGDPTPGTVPDPDDVVPTLRPITYSVTVDEWIPFTDATSVSL